MTAFGLKSVRLVRTKQGWTSVIHAYGYSRRGIDADPKHSGEGRKATRPTVRREQERDQENAKMADGYGY